MTFFAHSASKRVFTLRGSVPRCIQLMFTNKVLFAILHFFLFIRTLNYVAMLIFENFLPLLQFDKRRV